MTITIFDIASQFPEKSFSPHAWKARYSLNYKGVAHKTERIDFADIESHCIKLGIRPTSTSADGKPRYTLPAIHDSSTGVYISDSLLIAEYLEKKYPSAPSIFPHDSTGVLWPFEDTFEANLSALYPFILPFVGPNLTPRGEALFRETRKVTFGKTLEDLLPKGDAAVEQWAKLKGGLDKVDAWYAKSGGPYLLGDTVSWADFVVAAYFMWMRIAWGADSERWKDVSSWHGGRWKGLLENLKNLGLEVVH